MSAELAVFGGAPLFASPRPVGQLAAPLPETFLASLRELLESQSRDVVPRLEARLRDYHGVPHCIAFTNAGLAIIVLMKLLARGRRGETIMPAFSYRGLPHFAQWAGQTPRFCDVTGPTHGLDPELVRAAISAETTSILAVNNFNGPCQIDALLAIASDAKIPMFFDSVYGIGSTYRGTPLGGFGEAEVFSLHATKLLNGFEGGYVTTRSADLAAELRALNESAFDNRLNDVHAAMALLCLDDLPEVVERNRLRYATYARMCAGLEGFELLEYVDAESETHNYEMALVEVKEPWPLTRYEMVKILRAENVLITSYYNPPLHRSPHAPSNAPIPSLPAAEEFAKRFLQLPVGELMSIDDINRLGVYMRCLERDGASIARRLRSAV